MGETILVRRQLMPALAAIVALLLLLATGIFWTWRAANSPQGKTQQVGGPLTSVAGWVEPPPLAPRARELRAVRAKGVLAMFRTIEGWGIPVPDEGPLDPSPDGRDEMSSRVDSSVQQATSVQEEWRMRRVVQEKIEVEVLNTIEEARSRLKDDPGGAEELLKATLESLMRATELDTERKSKLRERIEAALRAVANERSINVVNRLADYERAAIEQDRRRVVQDLLARELKAAWARDKAEKEFAVGQQLSGPMVKFSTWIEPQPYFEPSLTQTRIGNLIPVSPLQMFRTIEY